MRRELNGNRANPIRQKAKPLLDGILRDNRHFGFAAKKDINP
jgi:hypothetical protein